MSTQSLQPLPSLVRLGFSEIEASIYLDLLRAPGSTGYAIGKSINKPHANVYQSLVALENKGAVFSEGGARKVFTAVPPPELIDQLRKQAEKEFSAVTTALADLGVKDSGEDHFYQLTTREQVYARARALLAQAAETVLIEAHPGPAEELRESLIEAQRRGVGIAGVAFRSRDLIENSKIVVSSVADTLLDRWTGEQLTLVVDGREFLLAFLDAEGGEVIRAIWVSSAYVAIIFHNAMASDVFLHGLESAKHIGSVNHHLFGQQPPSCAEVMARGKGARGVRKPTAEPKPIVGAASSGASNEPVSVPAAAAASDRGC